MDGRHQSLFRSDGIGTGLCLFVLTRFLHANRHPLRLKTLCKSSGNHRRKRRHGQSADGHLSGSGIKRSLQLLGRLLLS
jgi:hypothetical protein